MPGRESSSAAGTAAAAAACPARPVGAGQRAGGRRGSAIPAGRGGGFLCLRRLPGSSSGQMPRETGSSPVAAQGRGRRGAGSRGGTAPRMRGRGAADDRLIFPFSRSETSAPSETRTAGRKINRGGGGGGGMCGNKACEIYVRLVHRPKTEGESGYACVGVPAER